MLISADDIVQCVWDLFTCSAKLGALPWAAGELARPLSSGKWPASLLTTFAREWCALLTTGRMCFALLAIYDGLQVRSVMPLQVIVDTSNEIGGDGDVPHPAIGGARRMQVPDPSQQHRVMVRGSAGC